MADKDINSLKKELFNLKIMKKSGQLTDTSQFKKVKKQDWVFCSWRSHYQCLLKGVPKNKVKEE